MTMAQTTVTPYRARWSDDCPFCEYRTPRLTRSGAATNLRAHIKGCHRDRIIADAAYRAAITAGGSIGQAQAAYNAVLVPVDRRTSRHREDS